MPAPANALFVEMSSAALTPGRWFDALVPGDFTDMSGKRVEIAPADLAVYVANTKAAIAATQTESGEIVGLPIDARDHEKLDGAGWIADVALADGVLRILPKWTEIGVNLIGKSIRRFFSATFDPAQRIILGGTLTNWPATRDLSGKILLRPIELSHAGLYSLQSESLEERLARVREAWMRSQMQPLPELFPESTREDHIIVQEGERLWKVAYRLNDAGEIEFAPREEWVEVVRDYAEAASWLQRGWVMLSRLFPTALGPGARGGRAAPTPDEAPGIHGNEEVTDMKADELKKLIEDTVKGLLPGPAAAADGNGGTPAPALPTELAQVLGISTLSEEGKAELRRWMELQTQALREQAQLEHTVEMARLVRDNRTTELCQRLTGGSAEAPRGLKGVNAADLKRHLLALPADESKWFGDLLAGVVKDGLVEFAELGHGGQLKGTRPVPEYAHESLRAVVAAKNSIHEYFELVGLGNPDDYDLSPFVKKE